MAQGHDILESWQLAVGIATGLIGLLYYTNRKPAETPPPITTTPASPTGYGEVAGTATGAGLGVTPPAQTGQQTLSAGGPTPKPVGKLPEEGIPNEPGPGEGQAEWERNQLGRARPGAIAAPMVRAPFIGNTVQRQQLAALAGAAQ